MNYKYYREEAKRTMNTELTKEEKLSMLALGLTGEAGEVADLLKKVIYHGHTLDRQDLIKELGDVHFYLANLMNELDIDEEEVFDKNISKLKKRYPNGFNVQDSIKRVDTENKS